MLRILLVEDREDDIFMARRIIRKVREDAIISVARDSDEAIAFSMKGVPPVFDLVLLDIQLPGTDGFALLEQLRPDPAEAAFRVVFLTTSSSMNDRRRAAELGADGYIVKPMDIRDFEQEMRNVIERLHPF